MKRDGTPGNVLVVRATLRGNFEGVAGLLHTVCCLVAAQMSITGV